MKRLASSIAACVVLLGARIASAQDWGGGVSGSGASQPASGASTGTGPMEATPSGTGPIKQGRNSVKLFDLYNSTPSFQLDVGPIWSRRASETTALSRRTGFQHKAPLASEIAFGTVQTTRSLRGPFFLAAEQLSSIRILDDKSFSWTVFEEKLGGGIRIGPFDFETKLRLHVLSVDIMHAQPSIQLASPGIEAGFGIHLGRFRLDIKGHSEYLWRWFGPDYYIRGITIGLRLDAVRPKNPFPGTPPGQ